MHTIEVSEEEKIIQVPSTLEEMTMDQFIHFVELLLQFIRQEITIEQFKIRLLLKLADIRYSATYYMLSSSRKETIDAQVYHLSQLMDSFFVEETREEKPIWVLNTRFIKNFIPKICSKYFGPDDAMSNCTFAEYRSAYTFYKAYLSTNLEDDLNHMIAVLYRPKKRFYSILKHLGYFDGQKRIRFTCHSNPLFLEKRAKQIAKLPFAIRYGIFLFFSGCNENLSKGSIEVDQQVIDLSILYKKSDTSSSTSDIGLIGLLFSLAETKVFGSLDETDNQNIYDIMLRLYQVVRQYESLKAKQ